MKDNLTEIVFILDRSGSMGYLTDDTIGGYNAFIDTQKAVEGEALLTTILFDDEYIVLHNGVDIQKIEPLTKNQYFARGCTALLDAIGKTINTVGERLKNTDEADRPSKVIFVITTDGQENSSTEFTDDMIKGMITHQKTKYNWEFIFLGANIDAVKTASQYGIGLSANYTASSVGTDSLYTSMSRGISDYRVKGQVATDWSKDIK